MRRWRYGLGLAGAVAAVAAAATAPGRTAAAATQDYPAFVLVAGLLLIGLAAEEDGLFRSAGDRLAERVGSDLGLVVLGSALVGVVSAALNLDTAAAFLTPVLVQAGRRRPSAGPALLYAALLLSNAGSLLLPGSNLTNLIVLGGHGSGGEFLIRMALPWAASVVVTTAVLAWWSRRPGAGAQPLVPGAMADPATPPVLGLGLVGVGAAVVLMVTLSAPAIPVATLGLALAVLRLARRRLRLTDVEAVLDLPVLIGLLGVAVGLGTLAREWSGPGRLLAHADSWATAAVAAVSSVLVNNLPAASLLSARTPAHPHALLIGLDLGPNLLASGSLAWIIWFRSARRAGARPSLAVASGLGAPAAALSGAAAVALLSVVGAH